MMDRHTQIAANVEALRSRIEAAATRAGRSAAEVRLVAVTKAVDLEAVRILLDLGVTDLGENRIEIAREKIDAVGLGPCWHMIGNIQRRKARDVVTLFGVVDAIDRLSLAEALQRRCEEQDRRIAALIEINVSGESSKHGFAPEALAGALKDLRQLDRLDVRGLMTMAPWGAPEAALRDCFRKTRCLAEDQDLTEISMGMSDDFEIAIEEGATQVRIGRALFT